MELLYCLFLLILLAVVTVNWTRSLYKNRRLTQKICKLELTNQKLTDKLTEANHQLLLKSGISVQSLTEKMEQYRAYRMKGGQLDLYSWMRAESDQLEFP